MQKGTWQHTDKQLIGRHEDVQQHQVRLTAASVAPYEGVLMVEVPKHVATLAAVSHNRLQLFSHLAPIGYIYIIMAWLVRNQLHDNGINCECEEDFMVA